jgi:hypothetical protein
MADVSRIWRPFRPVVREEEGIPAEKGLNTGNYLIQISLG